MKEDEDQGRIETPKEALARNLSGQRMERKGSRVGWLRPFLALIIQALQRRANVHLV